MKRVIRLYYAFQFSFSLLLWFPIFFEFQKRSGLTDAEALGIQSIYYIAFAALEIPTGLIADRVSYRRVMIAGAALVTVSNLLPVFSPTYQGFLWEFLLLALSRSFISGASSAYLYEYLKQQGDASLFKGAEGKARAYSLVGKVIGWGALAVLGSEQLVLSYWLTALATGASVVFAWAMPEIHLAPVASRGGSGGRTDTWRNLRPALEMLLQSPAVPLVMVQGIAIFVLARIFQVNLFQPILSSRGFEASSFGLILGIATIFEAIGSGYPQVLRSRLTDLVSVFLLTAVMALSLSGTAVSGPWGVIAGMSVFGLATGLAYPIQRQLLNDVIPDTGFRATLLSMESLLDRAVCAWIAAILGGYLAAGKLDYFLHLSAAASVLLMLGVAIVLRWIPLSRNVSS